MFRFYHKFNHKYLLPNQWFLNLNNEFHSTIKQFKLATKRSELKDAKKVVVKLGSAVVTKPDRSALALGRLAAIVEQIADLCHEGRQCLLVTSGAIALGKHHLGMDSNTSSRGARAAVGMAEMVSLYGHLFEQCDLRTAAMLLTPIDFNDEHRRTYWRRALQDLLNQGVVPIINTNDAVAWDGETLISKNSDSKDAPLIQDNDSLAARLACELSSDILLLVSDVDGVYTAPPGSPGARFIEHFDVEENCDTDKLNPMVNGKPVYFGNKSNVGTGGMESKIASAIWTVRQGTSVVICRGSRLNCITDTMNGMEVGTFFTLKQKNGTNQSIEEINNDPVLQTACKARDASLCLNSISAQNRINAIELIADKLVEKQAEIILENTKDIRAAEKAGLQASLLARLQLGPSKIKVLSEGLKQIAAKSRETKGHVGRVIERTKLAENLILDKVTTPIGVLMVIFESRPDCLPQIAALSIATANGLLAKPGSEALNTVRILHRIICEALKASGLPSEAVVLLEGRKDVQRVLSAGHSNPLVDLVIPRGGPQMIQNVRALVNETGTGVPVMGHGSGICHVYIEEHADAEKALRIAQDSKCDYPAACNSMETLLIHKCHIESGLLEKLCSHLRTNGVKLYAGPHLTNLGLSMTKSMEPTKDLSYEYGDLRCTVELVDNLNQAMEHIVTYGSAHTDTIVTEDKNVAELFLRKLDSACVFHNVSTRFADGYRFGLGAEVGINTGRIHARGPVGVEGAEVGINTGRIHARGPVGVEGLLNSKWIIHGDGHCVSDFSKGKMKFLHERLSLN